MKLKSLRLLDFKALLIMTIACDGVIKLDFLIRKYVYLRPSLKYGESYEGGPRYTWSIEQ